MNVKIKTKIKYGMLKNIQLACWGKFHAKEFPPKLIRIIDISSIQTKEHPNNSMQYDQLCILIKDFRLRKEFERAFKIIAPIIRKRLEGRR